jgi:hypothetical protein
MEEVCSSETLECTNESTGVTAQETYMAHFHRRGTKTSLHWLNRLADYLTTLYRLQSLRNDKLDVEIVHDISVSTYYERVTAFFNKLSSVRKDKERTRYTEVTRGLN